MLNIKLIFRKLRANSKNSLSGRYKNEINPFKESFARLL